MACVPGQEKIEGTVEGVFAMIDEQLEFAISQYADGTLPSTQRAAMEAQIAADPALGRLLDEYRKLGSVLHTSAALPAINWDLLTSHLSNVIAEIDDRSEPVRIYAMPWVRRIAGLAVAACVVIVIGIGLHNRERPATVVGPAEIAVAGPMADAPIGAVVEQISVGPSPAVAMDDSPIRYSDSDVVSRPSRVVIASSDAPVQDTVQDSTATPY
jgi:anti-sigma factor RsiW